MEALRRDCAMMHYEPYHTDSYLREMNTIVTRMDEGRIALDRTVFYARGGGQLADQGVLSWVGGTARVVDVRRIDDAVWHLIEGAMPAVRTPIHGTLDWERRYALMRTHTATHILN